MKEAVEDFMSFVKPILNAFNIQIKEVSPKEIQKQLEKPELKPPKKEVVEPEVAMKREGGKVFIEVMLPGVKSERDIYLYEMEESVEVRADTKNKTYFRVISLPRNTRVLSTKFESEKLQIVLW
ncbi:MAG TPA: hypothetical protein ENG01_00055 [Candidatus Aenigmarchaeota archaeon]|nr:hypothetical protein [Candidatus Aenigmarchaeota archaeon]HEX32794.1 hypothetical protein [Candidatus Aenigmarchaeota archaeon]